jgi:hypothetical protein
VEVIALKMIYPNSKNDKGFKKEYIVSNKKRKGVINLSTLLTTPELKEFVLNKYEGLKISAQSEGIYCELNVDFSNEIPNNAEGTYAYSDDISYHYIFTEKGEITSHKISDDLFEISYWIFDDQIFNISLKYATHHKKNDQDFRRILFAKEMELLGLIGESYRKRCEITVEEILKISPYNDSGK